MRLCKSSLKPLGYSKRYRAKSCTLNNSGRTKVENGIDPLPLHDAKHLSLAKKWDDRKSSALNLELLLAKTGETWAAVPESSGTKCK